jgi:hypothetical protein
VPSLFSSLAGNGMRQTKEIYNPQRKKIEGRKKKKKKKREEGCLGK